MKITNIRKRGRRKECVVFVNMTPREAIATIESLSHQLNTGNPNGGRLETTCEDGTYFSIAVDAEPVRIDGRRVAI